MSCILLDALRIYTYDIYFEYILCYLWSYCILEDTEVILLYLYKVRICEATETSGLIEKCITICYIINKLNNKYLKLQQTNWLVITNGKKKMKMYQKVNMSIC